MLTGVLLSLDLLKRPREMLLFFSALLICEAALLAQKTPQNLPEPYRDVMTVPHNSHV
jgi:hypothetical protein